ncbi:IS630 family transposase, partial [Jiella sp. MQZ13P-4]|nr:IS630 family transposase [Jiella sonneratiae]
RFVILVLDGAGYHTKPNLAVPDGMRLVHQPAYTPEVQPAEHLWPLVDEPLANRYFETLGDLELVLEKRCRELDQQRQTVAAHTSFTWWPKPVRPT